MGSLSLKRRDGEKVIIRTPAGRARVITATFEKNGASRSVVFEADDDVSINREEVDIRKFPYGDLSPRSKKK